MGKLRQLLALSLTAIFFVACAKTEEEELNSAIREARYHLTNMDCSEAKKVLDDVGADKDNEKYVSVYASALACEAGYTDIGTALNNLTNITATTGGLLTSFAAFESSNETTADASTYAKLYEAIDYILNADGGTSPNTTNRLTKYGTNGGNDLSMQALLMITVAMGKYFAFYGNTDAAGTKGAGSVTGGDVCIAFYPFDATVDTMLSGGGAMNSCNSANAGHAALDPSTVTLTTVYRRMCEGIILFNNLFEILSNIDLSSNDSLGNIDAVQSTITQLYSSAQLAEAAASATWGEDAVATLKTMTSQSACETYAQTANGRADIQRYFLVLFETNL